MHQSESKWRRSSALCGTSRLLLISGQVLVWSRTWATQCTLSMRSESCRLPGDWQVPADLFSTWWPHRRKCGWSNGRNTGRMGSECCKSGQPDHGQWHKCHPYSTLQCQHLHRNDAVLILDHHFHFRPLLRVTPNKYCFTFSLQLPFVGGR